MHRIIFPLFISLVFLLGCVGTDIINDSSATVPARVEITPTTAAVLMDSTIAFQASYFDTLGQVVPTTHFQWLSSNTAIASIDKNGLATGKRAGQVMIIASANRVTSKPALLTVITDSNQVASVMVTPTSSTIGVGETVQLTARALNAMGATIFGKIFAWSTSKPAIVTVDNAGLATGIAPGTANITSMVDEIQSNSATVQVVGQRRIGTFMKKPGTSYDVNGTAILERLSTSSLVLRFSSDFNSSNGPGLEVYLSKNNMVNAQSRSLGRLKSTAGTQSYDVPTGIELDTFDWVIIHCVPFNVTFGFAELQEF